jgi:hypothetical protein
MSWWSDLTSAVSTYYSDAWAAATGGAVSNASGDVGTAAGAVSAAAGTGTVIEGIWAGLSDYKMWRSLGWILLGIVLMLLGALMLARESAGRIATELI